MTKRKYRDAPDHRLADAEIAELHELERNAGTGPTTLDQVLKLVPYDEPVVAVMSREEYRLAIRAREQLPALLRELEDWRRGRIS